uniref:Uncharacterized protein n=1 Tax=Rhizophora mucronata TaxID=61149 RepID=A0A2P2NJR2_RHIMU
MIRESLIKRGDVPVNNGFSYLWSVKSSMVLFLS